MATTTQAPPAGREAIYWLSRSAPRRAPAGEATFQCSGGSLFAD